MELQKVLVRHDADIHLKVKCGLSGHPNPCVDRVVKASELDAALTVQSYIHGKISGYDSGIRVKANYKLVNPERDLLKNGELCNCQECLK